MWARMYLTCADRDVGVIGQMVKFLSAGGQPPVATRQEVLVVPGYGMAMARAQ